MSLKRVLELNSYISKLQGPHWVDHRDDFENYIELAFHDFKCLLFPSESSSIFIITTKL